MTCIVVFDIDGVVRDVSQSYRRALADTVEYFTEGGCRPRMEDIDQLKGEGIWNNDWEASQELIYRYFAQKGRDRAIISLEFAEIVAYFQERYRGSNPVQWNGYIANEPLLLGASYLATLTAAGIDWGFFSGATRGSAEYILCKRLGLEQPVLVAMEDAPGKPDPTGLFAAVQRLERSPLPCPVFYVGDTVADMHTILKARKLQPERQWIAIGILPPHVQTDEQRQQAYAEQLQTAGAALVLANVEQLNPAQIERLLHP